MARLDEKCPAGGGQVYPARPSLQQRRWIAVGDILFLSSATYDVSESRLDVEYTFLRGNSRETKTAHTSIFTTGELRDMLDASGLVVESMLASPKGEPFRLGSPRLILTARKRPGGVT